MQSSKAALKHVAKAANVQYLHGVVRPGPADALLTSEVVEPVRTIARKLDYRMNAFASSLRTKRSNAIGILIPDLMNAVFPPIIAGIEETAAREGYEIHDCK